MSSSGKKMVTLKSSDGETFEIEEIVAVESQTIKNMVEDGYANNEIPLPNVTGGILAKVIEYCKKHVDTDMTEDDLKKFDTEFFKEDLPVLLELILAANFLNSNGLMDRACQEVANRIKGYSVEEIRKVFNIENDFTPDEEKKFREEHAWAFE